MVSLNTNNISIGSDGQVQFSGLSSGIDFQSIIDTTITAKRATAVSIENRIETNSQQMEDYASLKTLSETFQSSLDVLRGSTSFFGDDIFESKTSFFTSTAAAGAPASHEPSSAGELISASVASDAATGTHTITIQQIAKAHQVRSGAITDKTATLLSEGVTSGTFEIGGETITVSATHTLIDLQDDINAANAGVTATIVSASDTEHYLVITSEDSGTDNAIDFGTATQTSFDLGLTTANSGASVIANELQAAQNAILDVNGITNINRSDNEIDDIIEGVTLSLFQAEADTELTLTIDTDLNAVKTELLNFVDGYNAIRSFYDDQRTASDRDLTIDSDGDGDATNDSEFGSIAFDSTMRGIVEQMVTVAVSNNDSLTDGFQSLAQIGISVDEDFQLEIDEDILDNKLLTGVEDVGKLFKFDFTTSDSRVRYVSNTGDTTQGTYYLNFAGTDGDGDITDGTISASAGNGTADDGSLTLNGAAATATDGTGADGLTVLFVAGASAGAATDITVSFTRGLADQLYHYFEEVNQLGGRLDEINEQLVERNEDLEDQVETIDARLEVQREALERKYVAMEAALIQLESLKDTITGFVDAMNSDS
ncbi:MAG: flagellar filament capping protein FliD [Alphaproteobacteria bacterium]|nr:flagellar filament capping protein FliD [Alphaproteobacteria bacterium]MDD9919330.1 flagellar filament capping protein FliD [Alphaproteobacteria bacterium]